MPQFDISFYYSQIFWLAIVFGLLYFVVSSFIVPSAERIFQNRNNEKDSNINSAAVLAKQIKKLEESYDAIYERIIDAVDEIKRETLRKVNLAFQSKKEKLSLELDTKHEEVDKEILNAVTEFRLNKESFCLGSAGFIIKKITDKEINNQLLAECYEKISGSESSDAPFLDSATRRP